MDYLEGENVTVEAGRKAVRVCNWGSQPFTRVLRKDGSFAWIPHGFQCVTKEAGLQLLGETRVDEQNGPALFRFSVIGKPKAVGEWRANPTSALDNIHALVKNTKHRVGANGNVVIGITYDNLQKRINKLRDAPTMGTIEVKTRAPPKSRSSKTPTRRHSSRLAMKTVEVNPVAEMSQSPLSNIVKDFRMSDSHEPSLKRPRVIEDEVLDCESLVFDFPPLENTAESTAETSMFNLPVSMDEDMQALSNDMAPLLDCDVEALAKDLGLELSFPGGVITSLPDFEELGQLEEQDTVVDERKEFYCESSNTGAFDFTNVDDLLHSNEDWLMGDMQVC